MATNILLQEPVTASRVETATEALGLWREFADIKPALILFGNQPYLQPVPEDLEAQAISLIRDGNLEEINARTVDLTPNPILLHRMAVDAALKANLFSEFFWVIPHNKKGPPAKLSIVKENLLTIGWISQSEYDSLSEKDGVLHGHFRDTPVRISFSSKIPDIESPTFVHFDLSYFKPFYKNEVSTPIYTVILAELAKIKEKGYRALGASVSCSNLGKEMPLDVRFLGGDISIILNKPSTLSTGLPTLWAQRGENIYLENFFAKEKISENLKVMNEAAPDDAAVKFQSYRYNSGSTALDYLAQAVELDPMYALEYLDLSQTALEKGRPDAAVAMLENARNVFPNNPLITMSMAELQLKIGRKSEVLNLINQLKSLPWSEHYDPYMQDRLDKFAEAAEQLETNQTAPKEI